MINGPLYTITQDLSCHDQHTMPRNPWSFPMTGSAEMCFAWMCVCVAVAECVCRGFVAVVSGICYSDHWWLQVYLYDLHPPHVELVQSVQFYSIRAWLRCFGWYQHWWATWKVLSRPDYQVWQELKWDQALGIHRGSPFEVLTPLTGA